MIDLTGKHCAHPACDRPATVQVWGEGPRRDNGEMMRVEFGVCEEHEGATCNGNDCLNFPTHIVTGDRGNYMVLCASCSRFLTETPVVTIDGRSMMVKVEDDRLHFAALPEPKQG